MQYSKIHHQNKRGGREKLVLAVFCLLAIGLTFFVRHNAFFWDTVQLGSRHAHFYFENNFSTLLLPSEMDSGHPPFLGLYLAFCWKVFGKSLAVCHFAMLPFLLGTILLLFKLGKYFFENLNWQIALVGLVFFDPCWIGQAIMISPDVILVFGFLLTLLGILEARNFYIAIGIIFLCLISTRGMMVAASLFLFDYLNYFILQNEFNQIKERKFTLSKAFYKTLPYWIGGGLGLSFLIFHYVEAGWIGYHEDSSWAPLFARVGWRGMIRNVGVLSWRILDFGRIFLIVILLLSAVRFCIKKEILDQKIRQLILLLIMLFLFLTPSFILHKDLSSHRYLLPIFLIINLLTLYSIFIFFRKTVWRKVLVSLAFIGLSTGNFWIYPKHISQGWESTLAHLPYYNLRKKMIAYLDNNKIPISSVGTVFPNLATFELLDLNGRVEKFSEADLNQNQYVFYSNVYNDFADDEIVLLEKEWVELKVFRKRGVCVILYKRK